MLAGYQHNNMYLLAYASGSQGVNPNSLSHHQIMKSIDRDTFEISKADELDKIFENDTYEIIKKIDVKEVHTII